MFRENVSRLKPSRIAKDVYAQCYFLRVTRPRNRTTQFFENNIFLSLISLPRPLLRRRGITVWWWGVTRKFLIVSYRSMITRFDRKYRTDTRVIVEREKRLSLVRLSADLHAINCLRVNFFSIFYFFFILANGSTVREIFHIVRRNGVSTAHSA